jgi:hypothetical protein
VIRRIEEWASARKHRRLERLNWPELEDRYLSILYDLKGAEELYGTLYKAQRLLMRHSALSRLYRLTNRWQRIVKRLEPEERMYASYLHQKLKDAGRIDADFRMWREEDPYGRREPYDQWRKRHGL